jgi:hypothetical protein
MNIMLGTNDFFGVPFPLVLADRFFHIYATATGLKLDIFRWDEITKQPTYEVKASKPLIDNITSNPTGIIMFSEPVTGTFLYKFRPKPGVSQIFVKIPVNNEFNVRINDHQINVTVNDKSTCTLEKNQFRGMPIGIQIHADGSMGIGVNKLPVGMILTRS